MVMNAPMPNMRPMTATGAPMNLMPQGGLILDAAGFGQALLGLQQPEGQAPQMPTAPQAPRPAAIPAGGGGLEAMLAQLGLMSMPMKRLGG